jgi:hypothetical protein
MDSLHARGDQERAADVVQNGRQVYLTQLRVAVYTVIFCFLFGFGEEWAPVFKNSTEASKYVVFYKIQKNSIEMYLTSERNMNFLKIRKSAKFADNSVEQTVNL